MIKFVLIIQCLIYNSLILPTNSTQKQYGPGGLEPNEATTCEQFSQYARFNPYSVLDAEWMVFYYWGPVQSASFYRFFIVTDNYVEYVREILDGRVKKPIDWTARMVLMKERNNATSLLVERSDRAEYDLYMLFKGLKKGEMFVPLDVRFKQTGDNRFLGFMICQTHVVYALARLRDVPARARLAAAAARLGHRARGARSYLYRGHHWMPIPEAADAAYWQPAARRRWFLYD